jgi:hypothetical protein
LTGRVATPLEQVLLGFAAIAPRELLQEIVEKK